MSIAPTVSVITPCYNSGRFIERTIQSVKQQTFSDWEHVVVDDGSTDRSAELAAQEALADVRLRVVRQQNKGLCAARNRGLRAASPGSAYCLFLDADDCLESNALAELVAHLDGHPEAGMAYCARTFVDAEDRVLDPSSDRASMPKRYAPARLGFRTIPAGEANTPFESLMAYNLAVPSASLIRRTIIERVGPWDEALMQASGAYGEDVDMALRVALVSEVHFLAKPLLRYRRHGENMSNFMNYSGFAAMHRKWWRGERLTPPERALARHAILFDKKLTAWLQFRGAWDATRAGELQRAGRLTRQGTRKIGAYVLGYGRWRGEWIVQRFRPLGTSNAPRARATIGSERVGERLHSQQAEATRE